MKIIKVILVLSVFIGFSSISYGDSLNCQNKLGGSIHLIGDTPDSIAAKANQNSGYGSKGLDPITNGMLGGCYNMMQGVTGNSYNAQEMQKQQADYVRQQARE